MVKPKFSSQEERRTSFQPDSSALQSRGYVDAPSFHPEATSKKFHRFGVAAVLLAVMAASTFFLLGPPVRVAMKSPVEVSHSIAAPALGVLKRDFQGERILKESIAQQREPASFQHLTEQVKKEILSGERNLYTLEVTTAGAVGEVVRVEAEGGIVGTLDLSLLGSKIALPLRPGRPAELREVVVQVSPFSKEFSVTVEGNTITKPMKVGESITWTAVPK